MPFCRWLENNNWQLKNFKCPTTTATLVNAFYINSTERRISVYSKLGLDPKIWLQCLQHLQTYTITEPHIPASHALNFSIATFLSFKLTTTGKTARNLWALPHRVSDVSPSSRRMPNEWSEATFLPLPLPPACTLSCRQLNIYHKSLKSTNHTHSRRHSHQRWAQIARGAACPNAYQGAETKAYLNDTISAFTVHCDEHLELDSSGIVGLNNAQLMKAPPTHFVALLSLAGYGWLTECVTNPRTASCSQKFLTSLKTPAAFFWRSKQFGSQDLTWKTWQEPKPSALKLIRKMETEHRIKLHLLWRMVRCYWWMNNERKPDLSIMPCICFSLLFSDFLVNRYDDLLCFFFKQGRPSPAGGAVVPGSPIWNLCPPFHVWPLCCCIHPI